MSDRRKLLEMTIKSHQARDFPAAAAGYEALAEYMRKPEKGYKKAVLCAARSGDLNETARLYEKLFWSMASPKVAHLNDLLSLLHQTGRHESGIKALSRLFPDVGKETNRTASSDQVMVFSMPKSAGSSIVQTLAATLRIRQVASGNDDSLIPGYSSGLLHCPLLERLSGKRLLHQTHAMPWPENLQCVRKHCSRRFVVHMRDPRDALLSYYYMAEDYAMHRLRLLQLSPEYDRLPPSERMGLLVKHIYPRFLEWILGWVAAADAANGWARITTFEDFIQEPEAFFRGLLRFFGSKDLPLAQTRKAHFRKGGGGRADDPLLPPITRAELYESIPQAIRERFGWRPS